jgi:hypothetical protein
MEIVYGLIGLIVGIGAAWFYLHGRSPAAATTADSNERELRAILDEVRELRTEIDILKVNPAIGDAVKAALDHAHGQVDFEKSAYDVATRPTKLPASAYNVAVSPGRPPGGDVRN